MNTPQVVQPRSSNGYGSRKVERDSAIRSDGKFQTGKINSSKDSFGGVYESSSRDRLVYLTTCLIGHEVEVQVLDGSLYSGIFHATNDEDFGILLKMAHLIKDGSQGQKSISDFPRKLPSRSLIIPSKDLVQVTAKAVPVTRGGLSNVLQHERQLELLTDSFISQSRHVDAGRELERWVPDESDPGCPELENIFDGPWNRGWDQFEVNETLFGVKITFNEEFYSTKLERGPKTRELEREAMQIAREIEGEGTLDLHLAEERGFQLDGNLEHDEETRFSSVYRDVDDSRYDRIEDILLDSQNNETFGDASNSVIGKPLVGMISGKGSGGTQEPSRSSSMGEVQSSVSEDHGQPLVTEHHPKQSSVIDASRVLDNQRIEHAEGSSGLEDKDNQLFLDQSRASEAEDLDSLWGPRRDNSDLAAFSLDAKTFDPSDASSKRQETASSSNNQSDGALPPKTQGTASALSRPGSSASSTPEHGGGTSTSASQGLSPSPSLSSLSSEKSTLNPYAKEFRLNANAKSFVPSQTPLRSSSPVADSPLYYPANMTSITQMHAMPVDWTFCCTATCYVQYAGWANSTTILSSKCTSVWPADDDWTVSASRVHVCLSHRNALQGKGVLIDDGKQCSAVLSSSLGRKNFLMTNCLEILCRMKSPSADGTSPSFGVLTVPIADSCS